MNYIYYIKKEGCLYFAQSTNKNILFDWKHCTVLGFLFGGNSSFYSIHNADIIYSEYISDETKNLIKSYASNLSTINRDSFDVLDYDYSDYRAFLYNQEVKYEKSDSILPLFFNEITERNCIFAFAKAFVLQSINKTTEDFWGSDHKLKIKVPYKKLTDSIIDVFEYAGLLKPGYSETASQYFTDDNYYIVFENFEGCLKENLCEWLLDQEQSFYADVEEIENPRGNKTPPKEEPEAELPQVKGYKFVAQDREITYDGTFHPMPNVIAEVGAEPPLQNVKIQYRKIESAQWETSSNNSNPFSYRNVGSYVVVAKISPLPAFQDQYRPAYLYYNLIINRKEAVVSAIPETYTYDGEYHTLTNISIQDLGSGDILFTKPDLFEDKYINPGSFYVNINPKGFQIKTPNPFVPGEYISTKNNYKLTYVPGVLTIQQENTSDVPVPQESFSLPQKEGTPTSLIYVSNPGQLSLYRIPFIASYYKKSCVINTVSFTVDSVQESSCFIKIGFGFQDGQPQEITWCYTNSDYIVKPGTNKINLTVPGFSIDGFNPRYVYFGISPNTSTSFYLRGITLKDSNYIKPEHSDSEYGTWTDVSTVPLLSFYRNVNGSTDKVVDIIDGYNNFYSNLVPFSTKLSYIPHDDFNNYTRSVVTLSWFVKKEEIAFFGEKLNKIYLRQKEANAYPEAFTLSYCPVYSGSEWLDEDGNFVVKANDGILYIDTSSESFTMIGQGEYDYEGTDDSSDNPSMFFNVYPNVSLPDNAYGYLFTLLTFYGQEKLPVKSVLCENNSGSESYVGLALIENLGNIDDSTESLLPINFRPVMELHYNIDSEQSQSFNSAKKTVENWFPELFTLRELAPFKSISEDFELTNVVLDSVSDEHQFKLPSQETASFVKTENDRHTYNNVRGYRLSFCGFSENPNGSTVTITFGNNTYQVPLSGNYKMDVYRYISESLLPTDQGSNFVCSIYNNFSDPVYLSNICLIVDFIE